MHTTKDGSKASSDLIACLTAFEIRDLSIALSTKECNTVGGHVDADAMNTFARVILHELL